MRPARPRRPSPPPASWARPRATAGTAAATAAAPAPLAGDTAAKVHCYGKGVRPGRQIAHGSLVGASAADVDSVRQRATTVADIIRNGRAHSVAAPGTSEETA